MSFVNTIIIISHLPILAAVTSAVFLYRRLGHALQVFSWFLFLSGLVQFASLALFFAGKNNMPLLHFYVAVSLPLLVWFYKAVLGSFVSSRVMWAIALCFLVFAVINSLFIQDIYRFDSHALTVASVIIIILSLSTFIFLLNATMKTTAIENRKSLNWINSGLFIYYLSCLLIFYFGDMILFRFSRNISGVTWIFHSFFSVVMYTCFVIGLWKRSKVQHS